jgi:hypothetical protein
MALKHAIGERPAQSASLGADLAGLALADTAKSLRRTHATLHRTRPLTGRPDADAAVAATLAAFAAALSRGTVRPSTIVDGRGPASEGPRVSRGATLAEAVAGGTAALQRLGLRARLYADEILRARTHLEFAGPAWRAISPLAVLLDEFGDHCDTLSFDLRPARHQMDEALNALDAIGAGRAALARFTRSGGDITPVYTDAATTFLAEPAFTTQVTRATEAYALAEAARDRLTAALHLIRQTVEAL